MIKTSMQLKALIRNEANNDSMKAQNLLRYYMMERFLERISLSKYRNNFVLKGGLLVSSLIGVARRTTMDIDTTIQKFTLNEETIKIALNEIINLDIDDYIQFELTDVSRIMEERDYNGYRVTLLSKLDNVKQVLKLDISTGEELTPSAIDYSYKVLFENRSISLLSYNIETLLAEKLETIMSRSKFNTRMRDFYDVIELWSRYSKQINLSSLYDAFVATTKNRNTYTSIKEFVNILEAIKIDSVMKNNWINFQKNSLFNVNTEWEDVINNIINLYELMERKRYENE